jgi:hypothetical protein
MTLGVRCSTYLRPTKIIRAEEQFFEDCRSFPQMVKILPRRSDKKMLATKTFLLINFSETTQFLRGEPRSSSLRCAPFAGVQHKTQLMRIQASIYRDQELCQSAFKKEHCGHGFVEKGRNGSARLSDSSATYTRSISSFGIKIYEDARLRGVAFSREYLYYPQESVGDTPSGYLLASWER